MTKILALNCGSSSIKYALFDAENNYKKVAKGIAERIGQKDSFPDHRTAIHALYQEIKNQKIDIHAIGHRVVHGGDWYRNPVLITEEVIKHLKEAAKFAPLHSEPNITGIEVLQELLPDTPHIAVFDTAAHAAMEPKAFLYGIPIEYYKKHKIRKYGFHGINHDYVAREAAKIAAKPFEELKIITSHLGNGCSITAFEKGRSMDNSMGLTPLEGLVMGSRSGDLDPAVVLYLIDTLGLQTAQVSDLLNKKSGLLGLCGKSDMRDIIASALEKDKASQTAIEIFVYRIQKCIGAFIAALDGVDMMVFTGGIGENSSYIRAEIMSHFSYIGALIDPQKNEKNDPLFSSKDSSVLLMNIPANEEIVIAQQTYHLLAY